MWSTRDSSIFLPRRAETSASPPHLGRRPAAPRPHGPQPAANHRARRGPAATPSPPRAAGRTCDARPAPAPASAPSRMGRADAEGERAGGLRSAGSRELLAASGQQDAAALWGSVAQERSHPMTLSRHSVPLSGAGLHINNKPSDWPPVSIVSRSGAGPLANNKSPGWSSATDG